MEYTCIRCESTFHDKPSRNRRYCSRECRTEAQKRTVTMQCAQCGRDASIRPSQVKEYNFCNRKCKELAQRIGGIICPPHYRTGVHSYRKKGLKDHGATCKHCGYDKDGNRTWELR